MRVLVTGSTRGGSFLVRGEQLGRAIGAAVVRDAPLDELQKADVVVVVKKAKPLLAERLRHCRQPVVWDALDFFGQAEQAPKAALIQQARAMAEELGAKHVIGATWQMAQDLGSPYWLPHHGWERGRAPLRDRVLTVAYEGCEVYLSDKRAWIEEACAKIGAKFVVNPESYLSADVVVALRGLPYDSYASRCWKSGIKLSNAQVAGIPFVGARECGYIEQSTGAELWADQSGEIEFALDLLQHPGERRWRAEKMVSSAPRLPAIAAAYKRILERVLEGSR